MHSNLLVTRILDSRWCCTRSQVVCSCLSWMAVCRVIMDVDTLPCHSSAWTSFWASYSAHESGGIIVDVIAITVDMILLTVDMTLLTVDMTLDASPWT